MIATQGGEMAIEASEIAIMAKEIQEAQCRVGG